VRHDGPRIASRGGPGQTGNFRQFPIAGFPSVSGHSGAVGQRTKRRQGADDSSQGAGAPAVIPPTKSHAPAPRTKRGRPAKKPLKGAVVQAEDRFTIVVQKRRLDEIGKLARKLSQSDCGARDAAAALSVEARCTNKLLDLLLGDDQAAEIRDLRAQVSAMNAHLAGKKGSALRADVAPAPRVARRSESLQ
jgi:hypothetical protein